MPFSSSQRCVLIFCTLAGKNRADCTPALCHLRTYDQHSHVSHSALRQPFSRTEIVKAERDELHFHSPPAVKRSRNKLHGGDRPNQK